MTDDEKEVLKTGADALVKPFGELMQKLFGGPLEEIGAMWQDSLKVRRQVRLVKLFRKLQTQIEEAEFEPKLIPDKIWMPLLQAALMEDDDTIQDKWASLLANAANPNEIISVLPRFINILAELSPRDAKLFDALYAIAQETSHLPDVDPVNVTPFREHNIERIYIDVGLARGCDFEAREHYRDFSVTLGILTNTGLLTFKDRPEPTDGYEAEPLFPVIPKILADRVFHISPVGSAFANACHGPTLDKSALRKNSGKWAIGGDLSVLPS